MSVNYDALFADVATRLGVPRTPELEAEVISVVEDLTGSERPDAFISQAALQQRACEAADEADRYIAEVGEDGNAATWARTTAIQGAVFGSLSERIGNEATRKALERLRSAHRHLADLEARRSDREPLAATLSRPAAVATAGKGRVPSSRTGRAAQVEQWLMAGMTWNQYRQLTQREKAILRRDFSAEFWEWDDTLHTKDRRILTTAVLKPLIEAGRDLSRRWPDTRIYSLGSSPQWFVETARLIDPRPERFYHAPFSGHWYGFIDNGRSVRPFNQKGEKPPQKHVTAYRNYLEGIGLDPESIVRRSTPTILLEMPETGMGLVSFLYGILIPWARERRLLAGMVDKFRIRLIGHADDPSLRHLLKTLDQLGLDTAFIEIPDNLGGDLAYANERRSVRLVPRHDVFSHGRPDTDWEPSRPARLLRFRIMDVLALDFPEYIRSRGVSENRPRLERTPSPKKPGPANHRPDDEADGTRWPDHAAKAAAEGRSVPPLRPSKAEQLLAEWKPVIDFLRELLKRGNVTDDTPIRDICEAIVAGNRVGLWRALQRLNQLGILFPGTDRQTQVIYWRSLLAVPEFLEIRAAVAADILSHLEHRRIDPVGLNRAELQEAVSLFEQYQRAAEAKGAAIRAAQVEAQARAHWIVTLDHRLAQHGCLIEGNATQSLHLLLRSADQEPSEEKEELIADTIATVGWNPEMGSILRSFARHDTGEKIQLPKAYAFFERHYGTLGRYRGPLEPAGVLSLLKILVYPDSLRMSAFYDRIGFGTTGRRLPDDPVEIPGYDVAVREVLTEVRRLRREGHFTDDDLKPLPMSDPKTAIPIETLTPILEREYDRLFSRKNFRKKVEAAIYGYRYHDRLLHRGHPEYEDSNRATFQALYAVQVRGAASSGTLEPVSVDEGKGTPQIIDDRQRKNEHWLYDMGGVGDRDVRGHPDKLDQNGNLGRFYFAIKWEHRKAFWKKLTALMDKMASVDIAFQAKISLNTEHADTGDAAVLYFRSAFEDQMFDQKFVYHALCRMMADCPEEWFYDETSRPILAAQVFDPGGKIVRGLSFMQDALEEESSSNGVRAEAHATGIRNARLLRIIGAQVSVESEKLLMANALITQAKIDPEFPAFNLASEARPVSGRDLFGFIRSRTDQRDRPKTPGHPGAAPRSSGPASHVIPALSSPPRAKSVGGDPVRTSPPLRGGDEGEGDPEATLSPTLSKLGRASRDREQRAVCLLPPAEVSLLAPQGGGRSDFRVAGMTDGGNDTTPLRAQVITFATDRGLKKAAAIATRLSDKALAALSDRDRLNAVLDKTGYAWAKNGLGPWGRKIAASDLLLLGLAALARSDKEVALALQRLSGGETNVAAFAAGSSKGLPTGLTSVPLGLSASHPLFVAP